MKKIISILLLGFVFIANTYGSIVDTLVAKTVATNFYLEQIAQSSRLKSQLIVNRNVKLKLVKQENIGSSGLKSASVPAYYIFNVGENNGFVIVSADDCATPVLGYSFSGEFDSDRTLPPAFVAWMDNYKKQIVAVKSNNLKSVLTVHPDWKKYLEPGNLKSAASISVVLPMVSTTWSQDLYYNNFCPENTLGHALTGCVATAMGQIMKFWDHPASCTTIPGYDDPPAYDQDLNPVPDTDYGIIPAISPTTYDWASMPDNLNSGTPGTKVDAVAKLLYHCGVAVQMDYGPYVSSSYVDDAANALRDYFDYSTTTKMVNKYSYTTTAWKNLLIDELDNGRPFIYRGDDHGSSGHAWVCDGYQGSDFFHFNWGWGGYLNDYFYLDDITPLDMNFNSNNGAIIGIAPTNLVNLPDITLSAAQITSSSTVDAGSTVDVSVVQIYNGTSATVPDVSIHYYLSTDCLLDGSDVLLGDDFSSINSSTTSETETATLTIPEGTLSGSYKILFIADATNAVQESNEGNNTLCVGIIVNGVTIPEDVTLANIAVSAITVDAGGTIDVQVDQVYSGGSATVPNVYLYYCLSTDCTLDGTDLLLDQDYSSINSNDEFDSETAGLIIPGETPAGTYYLIFFADANNVVDESNEGNNIVCLEITVNNTAIPEDVFVSNAVITSPDTIAAGSTIDVSVDQNYSGNESSLFNVYIQYYLSMDCVLDGSDVYLGDDYSNLSKDDQFDTETASLTIPEETTEGTYYILFVADATDVVQETDNENNIACAEFAVIEEEVALVYLTIEGPDIMEEDSIASYICYATYSDSSKVVVNDLATWEINSPAALIEPGELSVGAVVEDEIITITVSFGGLSIDFDVTVLNVTPTLVYLTIDGPSELNEETTALYSCTATYSDSSKVDVTELATWEINSLNAEIDFGVFSAEAVDEDETITISASYEAFFANFEVTIADVPAMLVYLTIDGPAEVKEDSSAIYTCTATYSDSSRVDITGLALWETSSGLTTITSGLLTTGSIDEDEHCTISVSYEGKFTDHELLILNTPIVLVSISIDGPSHVYEDSSAVYACYALYSDSTVTDVTENTVWEINLSNVLISSGMMLTGPVDSDEEGTITAGYKEKETRHDVVVKNTIKVSAVLLREDGAENPIKIYPNPARNFVTVLFKSTELVHSEAKIINSTGSAVKTVLLNSADTKIDVSGLVSGIYIIQVQQEGFVYNEKLILDTGR